jgi:hypothetical protein
MSISKEKLIADAAVALDGDSVASFLRDGDGTKIQSTSNALNVFVTNPLELDVGLDAADDSVAAWLKDGSGNSLSSTSGALHIRIDSQTADVSVSATDLDIRDLAFATDSVDVSGSSVTVSATDLDIRDLAFATDSVDVSGSSVTASISGSVEVTATNLDIRDLSAATDSVDAKMSASTILASANSISTSAEAVVASALSGRRRLLIQNLGASPVYLGDSGVTTSSGIRVSAGANVELELGASAALYAVCAAGTADVRILEMA